MSRSGPAPIRRQAGAIPIRRGDDGEWRLLLVTSSSGRWIFPKGCVERGDSCAETARKETEEEAGVLGSIEAEPVGHIRQTRRRGPADVAYFLLRVEGELKAWKDSRRRARVWTRWQEALELLDDAELRELLFLALERLDSRDRSADG